MLVVILHVVFDNMFHTTKRGEDDVGTYGSYRVPYSIQQISRVSQYGYAKSRTVKIAHNIRETVSHLTVIQALPEVVNLT